MNLDPLRHRIEEITKRAADPDNHQVSYHDLMWALDLLSPALDVVEAAKARRDVWTKETLEALDQSLAAFTQAAEELK